MLGLAGQEGEGASGSLTPSRRPISSEPSREIHSYLVRVAAFGELLLAEAKHGPVTIAEELPVPFLLGPHKLEHSPPYALEATLDLVPLL